MGRGRTAKSAFLSLGCMVQGCSSKHGNADTFFPLIDGRAVCSVQSHFDDDVGGEGVGVIEGNCFKCCVYHEGEARNEHVA